jgi:uroporphyrinogen-III synthase
VQAILFSSANGVREFAKRESRRDLPVYAVGDASARAARAAGFTTVKSAGRDADALAKMVAAELKPADGALSHPRGRDTTGHLEDALHRAGFELRDPVVYRAEPRARLSDTARKLLADGAIDLALFFSPRTARAFVSAAEAARLTAVTGKVTAVCLSQAVAGALAPLSFAKMIVAAAPNQDALLAALPAAPRPRNRRPAWIYGVATLVVVALVLAVLYLMRPPETRIAAPAPVRDDPRIAALQQDFSLLRAEMQSIPGAQSAMNAKLTLAIRDLDDRITALEKRAEKGSVPGAELLIASAVLRDAVGRGAPYAAPLDTLAALAKNDAELQSAVGALRPGAASGVPTAPMLQARFDLVASAIARAAIAPPGSDWTDRLLARLAALVNFRRVGANAEGSSPDAVVARAEAKVKTGDLAGAVAELDTLTGAPADAARPWLGEAKARLAADKAVDTISTLALARLNKP